MKLALLLFAACAWAQIASDLENRAPVVIYKTEPEYTENARQAKLEGAVVLYVEIGVGGQARNFRVVRSLGRGLDEKAIECVRQWRFDPALKDGKPVPARATVEVNFRLKPNLH